ncbi:MAG: ABC transporter permease subunit, partial [candidate division Zixibacteria bacterium]|nr:ABC transporter permease subunit [candidate division Zixibacteria bacterium]
MKRTLIVYQKEMLDMLRDRRTIISMVIVPLLLFPIMTIGISSVISSQIEKTQAEIHTVAIHGGEFYPEMEDYLRNSKVLRIVNIGDYQSAVKAKRINAAVEIGKGAQHTVESGGSASVRVYYDAAEIKSEFARDKIYRLLNEFEDSIVARRLDDVGAGLELLDPLATESTNLATQEKMSGMMLATFLPYMIIILSMVGAMYPAIDLTAGEKERGTMETILASPASRLEISIGKFLTVFTTSFVTALLSITSLTLTTALGIASINQMST